MLRLVFLGPPGAGKGTQAAELSRSLGILHLSTGDLLRAAVAARTPLGVEAERFMHAGQLVPDELVLQILAERLRTREAAFGFLLDGFPRTRAQAEALDAITPIDRVVSFEIPEALLRERLTQRRSCPKCGTVYNLATRPPRTSGRCDLDGVDLTHRSDDREDAVDTRLQAYRRLTAPLAEYYRARGVLRPIDATGTPEDVGRRVRSAID